MAMENLYKEVMEINMMEDNDNKEAAAKAFFEKLNFMELPEYFNWAEEIFEGLHVKERGDHTALVWTDIATKEEASFTYSQFAARGNQCLNALRGAGIEKGDNMYMMNPIVPETWFSHYACVKGGLVNVPTATSMTMRELQFRFEAYAPDCIVCAEEFTELMDEALKETGTAPKIKIVLGAKEGWVSYTELEKQAETAEAAKTKSDDVIFCFFTSGTTGLPKRVGHTAGSYPIGHLSTSVLTGIQPTDIHHNLSAPGWAKWAWSSFFGPLNVGATVAGFNFTVLDGKQYLEAIEKHKVSIFCAPPTAWRMFINMDMSKYDLSSLRQSIGAGEPLNPEVITQWKEATGTEIRDFYGQTESTAMIGNPPWMKGKMKSGSFGYPSFMYDVALVDDEGKEITVPDEPGHIVVKLDKWRAIGLFTEYIGSPEKMASVFVDNYYYTGDRASIDTDGYWWFVGRADDVIKSSDFRVGPFEVESALVEHPSVGEAAVIGSPDPKRHQLVKAYVILNAGFEPSRELALEIFQHTINILAKFKIPRIIEFVTEVPKTISGKIRRIELRENEVARKEKGEGPASEEYFYWDFPELSSKKK
ncbi:acetyl-CoA synthetase/4-hydroxybutyrate---CoA ligase (AMP-forming) [Desulfocicer vacuolatum DSM 3385]|uniref:Acetyl-CoA synthetase/4-hydroxybutyrate---CoA ligase (AMP-forming) n=1 Tax=Desulfocicer vacuolatum DSM 3385 TaxID=1121400 RepID=A0A1W2DB16_9BACT|nr:AMP-binding protein [Desulfocicer vacuolatum]SMC94621.1 acetyl-CoA synthetase/4-hydroxybutyrate---CoA ligase (AMP-forming) [Desulfocicer vacuolatum DSM 3385]